MDKGFPGFSLLGQWENSASYSRLIPGIDRLYKTPYLSSVGDPQASHEITLESVPVFMVASGRGVARDRG
jgi:hypothetical protein